MPLIPEEKGVENEYRRIAAAVVFIIGVVSLTWFVFHLIHCWANEIPYDFLSLVSVTRLVIGVIGIALGTAMHKFIDWNYDRPALRR